MRRDEWLARQINATRAMADGRNCQPDRRLKDLESKVSTLQIIVGLMFGALILGPSIEKVVDKLFADSTEQRPDPELPVAAPVRPQGIPAAPQQRDTRLPDEPAIPPDRLGHVPVASTPTLLPTHSGAPQ